VLVSKKPRMLFISPRFLFPMNEGGKIRTANILRHLKGGAFEMQLASPVPPGHAAFADDIAAICDSFLSWPAPAPSRLARAAKLFGALPISVATDRSRQGRQVIARALAGKPDVVVIDFPHAAVLMPDQFPAASVIFTHNIEAEIYERHAMAAQGMWQPIWRDQARKMQRFEHKVLHAARRVIAVSRRDGLALEKRYGLAPVDCIDTGVDLDFFAYNAATPTVAPDGGRVVFTGVMDSPANIDGIKFLMDEIWPHVVAARPKAEAVIVGRNPPAALVEEAAKRGLAWRFTGFVDDIRPYMADADIALIPLRVGSGTRIKTFEAMAAGRAVVGTTIGVEGLDITPGTHYLRADAPADFANAVVRLLANPHLRNQMRDTARRHLEQNFAWARVAAQFSAICQAAMVG
jgi:glycosyltransferase involved in cell wall biosynthesis